jgi:hypothetical protein
VQWKKLGLVWKPSGEAPWARTHAMGPTPWRLNDDTIRVFVTCLDEQGRGRPGFVDVDAHDPKRVLQIGPEPVLDIGVPGAFDDNGVMAISVIEPSKGIFWMYYAGFELCKHIRYRILSGVAVSRDGGKRFERIGRVPVLERSDTELYFRCGPFALIDGGIIKLWYVAGSEWTDIGGKAMPIYDLRYQESSDGTSWSRSGTLSMAITGADEHGFGRPWVVKRGPSDYQLFYSIRRRSLGAYRLGYAESSDGVNWKRKDAQMGLDVTPGSFDSDAIMYSAVISVGERTYCFFNGNNFGEQGFAVAELLV